VSVRSSSKHRKLENDDDVHDRIKKAVRLTEAAVRATPEFRRLHRLTRAYNLPYRATDGPSSVHTARRDAAIMEAWKAANVDSGGGTKAARPPLFEEVVKWLHANRTEGCTWKAMDFAAMYGHLDVVKWLHTNRTEGCTKWAMDFAALNGHLDVVKWLHAHRSEGCTTQAMGGAAVYGHLDVVEWLHAYRREGCTRWAMDGAAVHGHLDVLKWLHANRVLRDEGCSTWAMDWAAENGHLDVLKWLHDGRDGLGGREWSPGCCGVAATARQPHDSC